MNALEEAMETVESFSTLDVVEASLVVVAAALAAAVIVAVLQYAVYNDIALFTSIVASLHWRLAQEDT
jgi:hypothetical protein